MSKKSPFYKTGPLFYKPGAMSPLNENEITVEDSDGEANSKPATEASNISLGRVTASTIGTDYSNFDFGSKNLTSTETPKIDVEAGIATGKGSGKTNRARRKQKKDKMKAEGKSTADIRQTKAKSKRLETKAKMESLQQSGDKSQATKNKIARLDAKRGRLKKREARIEGRKAKKRETAKYLKNN